MKPEYREVLDGTRRYNGQAKATLLTQLANEANAEHQAAHGAWRTALEHAKRAGDALRVAKRICGGRSKWSKWRRDNFKASVQTSRVYMQVSRHWHDIRIREARDEGITIDSIQKFLNVIRGRHNGSSNKQTYLQ